MKARGNDGWTCAVKVLVSENCDNDAQQEVARFTTIDEAVRFSKRVIDLFLHTHRKVGTTGHDLYRSFVKFGPDVEVDASLGYPVFEGWEYAKRQCLG